MCCSWLGSDPRNGVGDVAILALLSTLRRAPSEDHPGGWMVPELA